ncbi:MAG: Tex family protein [Marinifilaceae bacterium]
MNFSDRIAKELSLQKSQVENTIKLFEEGASLPFIARYRKEFTGSLDEVEIGNIKDRLSKLGEIEKRRSTILDSINEQGKLSDELKRKIENAPEMNILEDLYLPFKQKRKTRADKAREIGLEPLAKIIMSQRESDVDAVAARFTSKKVDTEDTALQGARDIIAEWVNESIPARDTIRRIFSREAIISAKAVKGKEEEGAKYKDYFGHSEPLRRCASHRLMALRRGESEGFLKLSISIDGEDAQESLNRIFVKSKNECSKEIEKAVKDSFKRLLSPSIETEFANINKEKADAEAIAVFASNLEQLLLSSPLGQKRVLGIDPGFKSGCKIVCLDAQGNLLHNETIYPHAPQRDTKMAAKKITHLVSVYDIEAVAIGNGTASRETDRFIANLQYDRKIQVYVVSENGASVYSASKTARDEFPDYDVTVRGAVSIGRRLMDPLAELVKIEPKAIGVGQYQHDVDQNKLHASLDRVVETCVNKVGVNLNTASKHILTYVSGLGATLAQNIVDYRKDNGAFNNRKELLKVKRMGAKAFEQSAGFLRIRNGDNHLDNTAVHPESYAIVKKMVKDLACNIEDLAGNEKKCKEIDLNKYVTDKIGLPTLKDIISELEKPGRDPRSIAKVFQFDDSVSKVEHLQVGMELPGIVTNITNFGAFVDVGVKQDGLVHISELADKFVSNPNDVVKLHQHVIVKVTEVDIARKRIQLSMKQVN